MNPILAITVGWTPEPLEIEMTFTDVDPTALGILTGGVMGTPPAAGFSMTITSPIKRTFWQWLRRKPRRWRHTTIPRCRLANPKEDQ